jgi:hypothetical protein
MNRDVILFEKANQIVPPNAPVTARRFENANATRFGPLSDGVRGDVAILGHFRGAERLFGFHK